MIVITIAFVSCISWLRSGMERYADRKLSLCCQFFVSGFVGLLTDLFMRRGFSPLHKRIASAFSRSHDSPSNDRFSPHAGIPRMENNTLELQLLSESCRALAISNVQTAILRWIPSVSGILTRFPCSANKHACPIARVAHVPQKPWYVILGTIAVVSYESSFAKLAFFGKRCIRSFHCFLRKQGQLH